MEYKDMYMEPRDRYALQLARQNSGLPCSDCGSHKGHFYFCTALTGYWNAEVSQSEEVSMEDVLGKAKPYMQDENAVPEFDVADTRWLKAMGVLL
jgi:hypothetical protein